MKYLNTIDWGSLEWQANRLTLSAMRSNVNQHNAFLVIPLPLVKAFNTAGITYVGCVVVERLRLVNMTIGHIIPMGRNLSLLKDDIVALRKMIAVVDLTATHIYMGYHYTP